MHELSRTNGSTPVPISRGDVFRRIVTHELVLFAVATLIVWAHTIDEMRIGEFIAVPFGVANLALVGVWPRLPRGWRAASSIIFGLFWGLAVIPYHVLPLLEGSLYGQHISGLSRVVGGAAMVVLGVAIARRREAP